MGSAGEKLELEFDEEIPFSSSQATIKIDSLHYEAPHIVSPRSYRSSRVLRKMYQISLLRSIYIVVIKAKINVLLPFGPLAILLHYVTGKHAWVFFFSLLGITPLAERLGYATEQLAFYTGPTEVGCMVNMFHHYKIEKVPTGNLISIGLAEVGGLLNATFGNATEMIISLYALNNGMMRVVKQSLLGSILSNMLLVLGCAFFSGGIIHQEKVQVFNKATAIVNSGLLLMAVMGLLFPAVLHFTHTELHFGKSQLALSRFSSCIMLVAYASYLFFQLKSQPNLYRSDGEHNSEDSEEEEAPEITQWEAIGWLAVLTTWISVLSGYLVDAIEGASDSMNLPMSFISVILLPIVGNAAEHASAIMFAMKDKLDITLGVAIGSSTQISMFVIPFCVVVGWFMGKPMNLNFQLFETATLFITVLVVAFMLQDSETIEEFSNKLMKVVNQIRLMREELIDSRIVEKVLVSLPKRFEAKISSLEDSKDLIKLSPSNFVHALQAQEQRRSLRLEEATETALQAKFKGKMQMQEEGIPETFTNSCRNNQGDSRNGVKKKENFPPCKVKKENNQQTQKANVSEVEEQEEFVFTAVAATRLNDENTWFVDSGCTQHMTSKREYFTKLESAKGSVKLADKTTLDIVGKETVAIEAPKGGSFTVTRDVNVEQLGRGTKITLFLKEDQLEYLEERRIKDLVKKYSEFISYPIYLWAEKSTVKESVMMKTMSPRKTMGVQCRDFVASSIAAYGEVGKSTSEKPDVPHDEQLTATKMGRRIKLLQKLHRQLVIGGILSEADFWAARKRLLEQTENKKPKQRVALKNDIFAEKPAVCRAYLNFVPGKMSGKEFWTKYSRAEYLHSTKNIFATFAHASEDEELAVFLKQDAMLESEARKKMNNIKLYVWRVFIMDNCKELMPEYLGFVKGVVDSDDLSLNISREMLQQNNILKVIGKNLVKKCIEMFNEIAESKEGLMLASIFTKALPKFRFETLHEQLGVTSKHLKEEC
ncbi:Vacuolar cation/proton exchanger 2 [Capsicum annuum]|nr:Vacuolar cation/proton exchanger 2 [Capsicum annuum]KAF3659274.1 Vacuolar cation/proton exchanger 2 [Capsicum annuum]